jgi:response regulator RpfG family c-di-GMP phosphodiesterase
MCPLEKIVNQGPLESCRICGARIVGTTAGHRAGKRCCESCYLDGCKLDTGAFDRAYEAFAEALSAALDAREHETGLHSKRVACHTLVVARHFITEPAPMRQVYWGALLHDIGKIAVPDSVLLNEGPLDAAEWSLTRTHPEAGKRILDHLPGFDEATEIVLCHEERYDGSGYPGGLCGEQIPLGARLFAVIDTLDAMTSDRPYRRGLDFDAAKVEIERMRGSQFDPLAVDAFLQEEATLRQMVALKCGDAILPLARGRGR